MRVRSILARALTVVGASLIMATALPAMAHAQFVDFMWGGDKDRAAMDPRAAITSADGQTEVAYPYFRDVEEGTRTIGVSVYVDHYDFAFPGAIHIDLPREDDSPYEVKLEYGGHVELRPTILGEPADTEDLFALWSDGRSWRPPSG